MPFPMKIQPLDLHVLGEAPSPNRLEAVKPPPPTVVKSRLKRIFDLQCLRNSAAASVAEEQPQPLYSSAGAADFEPSSVSLDKMVQNFIEENNNNEKQSARCGGRNCFNGNCNDSSEDEFDSLFGLGFGLSDSTLSSSGETIEILKSLVPHCSACERNLLVDTAKIVQKNRIAKRKDDFCRKIVADGLLALGYDASICKSHWEKSSSYPAGEYEYIDVIIEGERLIIDIDFRSEFEIARSTKTYKTILQVLPFIFIGTSDRLEKIISIMSEAAKQSLKKKGLHIPPWRKAEYVKSKWLSPHIRANPPKDSSGLIQNPADETDSGEQKATVLEWKPPSPPEVKIKPKSLSMGVKVVSGLASIIEDDP